MVYIDLDVILCIVVWEVVEYEYEVKKGDNCSQDMHTKGQRRELRMMRTHTMIKMTRVI